MASAHSATPPPPPTPKSSQPRPGSNSSGGYGRGGHSPSAPAGAGSIPAPLGDHPTSDGTHTRHGPLCPGMSVPPSSNHYTEPMLETLHKHLETRLKITAHHPRTYKTSKGLILPREIYQTLSSIKGLEEEVGVIKKEKSKLKTHTRHRTRKHTDTTGLVGKRGNIQGKRTNNTIRYPC
jgi:hypothetical protein